MASLWSKSMDKRALKNYLPKKVSHNLFKVLLYRAGIN